MYFTHKMDAPRTDLESRAPLKHTRGCKVTLLVALQNVLLTGCLFAVLYLYWTSKDPVHPELQDSLDDVSILFFPINDIDGNKTLKFNVIPHQYKMTLSNGSKISTNCTGPYILHMYVCYRSLEGEAHGSLQLQTEGKTDPLCTFELHAQNEFYVCRGLQSNAYLRKEEAVELRLYSTEHFWIKNVKVGFHYLLGSRCDF